MQRQRGFTLVAFLAVMAILAVLAAIIVPAVSGASETSRDAQTQQDATAADTASADFFNAQGNAEVLESETVTVIGTINGAFASTSTTQTVSSRWPELFITAEDVATTSAKYRAEFPTAGTEFSERNVNVIIINQNGFAIQGETLLSEFTAIDFEELLSGGFVQKIPDSVDSISRDFHNFLWLFRKQTSSGGSAEFDTGKVVVFKLTKVVEVEEFQLEPSPEPTGTPVGGTPTPVPSPEPTPPAFPVSGFILTYEQIF